MKLRSSKGLLPSSATVEKQPFIRLDARHDAEVSYHPSSTDAVDVSSVCHHGVAAVTVLPRTHRVPSARILKRVVDGVSGPTMRTLS